MSQTGMGMVGDKEGKQPSGYEWSLHSSAGQVRQQPAEHKAVFQLDVVTAPSCTRPARSLECFVLVQSED